jgi:hypothetical protein
MKTVIVGFLLLCITFCLEAQYQGGIGIYLNTTSPAFSEDFLQEGTNSIDISLKMVLSNYECYDLICGWNNDNTNFSLIKEVHRQLFYPVDIYLGIGFDIGKWNKKYLSVNNVSSFFGGIDGSAGLQFSFLPISISFGFRPVWIFLGSDQFYCLKQIGIRVCY